MQDVAVASDDAFTLFYGKFRTNAPKVKALVTEIENRLDKSPEWAIVILDCGYFPSILIAAVADNVTAEVCIKLLWWKNVGEKS